MSKKRHLDTKQINIVNVHPSQDSNVTEDPNYNLLKEDFKSKQDTVDESSTLIENRTYEIASGGLALSLTVLSYLDTKGRVPEGWRWMPIVIWICFTICIILHYWSHFVSRRSAERTRDKIGKMIREAENYDAERINSVAYKEERYLRIINILTPTFLMLGVIGLISFTSVCISTH